MLMMRKSHKTQRWITAAALVGMAGLPLAGCGGGEATPQPTPSTHQPSAASACRDFGSWVLANSSNILAGNKRSLLSQAVSEAPSGQLYQDMSTLQSDVNTASAASSDLQSAEKGMSVSAAYAVEQDCQSVNPSS